MYRGLISKGSRILAGMGYQDTIFNRIIDRAIGYKFPIYLLRRKIVIKSRRISVTRYRLKGIDKCGDFGVDC